LRCVRAFCDPLFACAPRSHAGRLHARLRKGGAVPVGPVLIVGTRGGGLQLFAQMAMDVSEDGQQLITSSKGFNGVGAEIRVRATRAAAPTAAPLLPPLVPHWCPTGVPLLPHRCPTAAPLLPPLLHHCCPTAAPLLPHRCTTAAPLQRSARVCCVSPPPPHRQPRQLWDLRTRAEVRQYRGHTFDAVACQFVPPALAPPGAPPMLVTASKDCR
jgi:hypothetical protein